MVRIILELLTAIIFFIWGVFTEDTNLQPELKGMAIGTISVFLIECIILLNSNWGFLKLYWDSYKPWGQKEIRLTIAYLFRIENNGKYLLIKSNRIANTYQPVGGVYKYFHPETTTKFNEIGIITDNSIENDEDSENDLRVKLKNKCNLPKFLDWFMQKTQREIDPWREFYEELVATVILPPEDFKYIHYELVGQHYDRIHFDERFRVDTFKYVDVFVAKCINEKQINAIKNLRDTLSDKYVWATEAEIKNRRTEDGKAITQHSYKIFQNKKLK